MILEKDVFKIGKLTKTHGIKGEIVFAFDNDIFDKVDNPYLICLIDGIFVPFFMEEYRFNGKESVLVKFEDIGSDEKARRLINTEVYFPRSFLADDNVEVTYSWNYFIGFSVIDNANNSLVGVIDQVDESTINTLFIVKSENEEILIPASEDFITEIDASDKLIKMDLPEGLL